MGKKKRHCAWNKGLTGKEYLKHFREGKTWNKDLNGEEYLKHFREGKTWNKGLTKETNKSLMKISRGMQGVPRKEETKRKLRIHFLGKTYEERFGRQKSEEIKGKLSKVHLGEKQDKEWVKKRTTKGGETLRRRWAKGELRHPRLGKSHSIEAREKIKKSRKLRVYKTKNTSIEIKIQEFLKQLGIEFFTHFYIKDIRNKYRCDIFIPVQDGILQRIVIECDGDYWHGNPEIFLDEKLTEKIIKQREIDDTRTKQLIEKGYNVLRIWENEIKRITLNNFEERLKNVF